MKKAELAAEAWRQIFDFIIQTAPERNRYIGEIGLTPNDARALLSLTNRSGRTMGSLAEEWKCDASTATWIVDRLEGRGLVQRRAHATDRRVKLVFLTRKGTQLQEKQMKRVYRPPSRLLQLEVSELIALRDAAGRLNRSDGSSRGSGAGTDEPQP